MKKGWKTFWIVCAALIVVGIGMCIAGALLGGTVEAVKLVFGEGSVVSWFDSGSGSSAEKVSDSPNPESENKRELLRYTGIDELEMEVTCLEVVIRKGDGADVTVDIENVPDDMMKYLEVKKEGKKLSIETDHPSRWEAYMKNNAGTLTIEIPGYLKDASLSIGAGIMTVEEIYAGELEIQVGAGSVNVDSFEADDVELTCGVGEATVAGDAAEKVKIECGVGSVTYYASGSQQDYDYKLECGIGNLDVGEISYSGLGHQQTINNGSGREMEIKCGLGNVTVAFDR